MRCIAIRAAYGGMAGDVTMLREFAAVWSSRSATTATAHDDDKNTCATSVSRCAGRVVAKVQCGKRTCCDHMHAKMYLQTLPRLVQ